MDFIDLDEELQTPTIFTISPDLPISRLSNSSSFESLRSETSVKGIFISLEGVEDGDVNVNERKNKEVVGHFDNFHEFKIVLNDSNSTAILRFNPKGPHLEGRDSQVFQGTLHCNNGIIIPVSIKIYREDLEALKGAHKEIEVSRITQNRRDFLKLYYSGSLDNFYNFVSIWEWIEGGTLDRFISKIDIFHIIRSISSSLNYLHSNRIAHHDLKPHNILYSPSNDRIILIDFGDSKILSSSNEMIPLDEGIGLGTLAYTAPELLSKRSGDCYSPLMADVYSFGVLLFYILNKGKILPFSTLIPHRAVHLILTVQKGFFAGEYNPESPKSSSLFPLMKTCLQVDPFKRPKFKEIISIIEETIPQ